MIYKFKTLTLHNFLSFGDATIDLTDRGFCLIYGKNNNPSDRALSNGSGKSTIVSGISYCLTGQTIQGIKSNIENIHTNGGCYVSLEFSAGADDFIVTRYKNHEKFKTDLKIYKNGEDISGKGIKLSENVLVQELPELTPQLISSVILLGQGLPNSFTKNSPSGRKELLEQLTGSDFMIQDVKDRISKRIEKIENEQKGYDDKNIALNSQNKVYNDSLASIKSEIENHKVVNYDEEISKIDNLIINNTNEINILKSNLIETQDKVQRCGDIVNENEAEKYSLINECKTKHQKELDDTSTKLTEKSVLLRTAKQQKQQMESISDVCPTCGQKLIGVVKPDTTQITKDIEILSEEVNKLTKLKTDLQNNVRTEVDKITKEYDDVNNENKRLLNELKNQLISLDSDINNLNNKNTSLMMDKSKLEANKLNDATKLDNLNKQLKDIENKINTTNTELLYNNKKLEELKEHLGIVNKINTLVKRDFRGYLLKGIITYLQSKAQEYCEYIFSTKDLLIQLDGNDIDILFQGKQFESLSGGEKQKVDVIIQFAIRNMMSNYLNFSSNILFLDEITDNLDSVGCSGLFNLITQTLSDVESIFIISHHQDELSLPIDNTILVEKNSNGISRIV